MMFIFVFLVCLESPVLSNNLDKEIETFILNNPEVILKSLENYEIQREKEENDKAKKESKKSK